MKIEETDYSQPFFFKNCLHGNMPKWWKLVFIYSFILLISYWGYKVKSLISLMGFLPKQGTVMVELTPRDQFLMLCISCRNVKYHKWEGAGAVSFRELRKKVMKSWAEQTVGAEFKTIFLGPVSWEDWMHKQVCILSMSVCQTPIHTSFIAYD